MKDLTFGPVYDTERDGKRIATQMERVLHVMESHGDWLTLQEIAALTNAPTPSVSAQLRHLRKARFGSHTIGRRMRSPSTGLWEYRLIR